MPNPAPLVRSISRREIMPARGLGILDFIDVGWWPIFNLADSSIVVGIAILISVMMFNNGEREEGGRDND